jgi:hypothetical protein
MAVQYGSIPSGTSASSAFVLSDASRPLLVGVSSHSQLCWFAAFQPTAGGLWLRFVDPWGAYSGALVATAAGGWGLCSHPPSTVVRIETNATVSATTSFALIEHAGR